MKRPPLGLAVAALLYGAICLTANAVAADLTLAERDGLKSLRAGDMAKLVIHDAPRPRIEVPFRDLYGNRITLADYEGKVVLLNIWATWCPPCIKEMPELERLQRVHADAGLVVLHLSDEDRGTLLAWLEKRSEPAVHAYARPLPWPEPGRPTTFVVDRQGVVRRVLLGARSYEQFEAAIEEHL